MAGNGALLGGLKKSAAAFRSPCFLAYGHAIEFCMTKAMRVVARRIPRLRSVLIAAVSPVGGQRFRRSGPNKAESPPTCVDGDSEMGWLTGLELLSRSVTCIFRMLRKWALNWLSVGVAGVQQGCWGRRFSNGLWMGLWMVGRSIRCPDAQRVTYSYRQRGFLAFPFLVVWLSAGAGPPRKPTSRPTPGVATAAWGLLISGVAQIFGTDTK